MKKFLIFVFIFVSILLYSNEITLEYLIDKGLKNSLDIKYDKLDLKSEKINLITSYLSLTPSASVSASKNYFNGKESLISSGFSLSESFSWNDGRYFSIKNAIISKKNGELNFIQRKRDFIYNLFLKYISILKAQNNLKILKKNLEIEKETFKQTKLKFESGMINKLEFKQAEFSLLSMQINLKTAKDDLKNKRYDLFSYVGINDNGNPLKDINFDISFPDSIQIIDNNDIKIEKNSLKMSKLSLTQQKLNLYPNLSVSFSYSYSSVPPYDFTRFNKYSKSHSVGIGFSYGIFDIPSKHLNYSLAKRRFRLKQLQYQKKIKDYKNDMKHYIEDFKSSVETFKLEKQKLKMSEDNFKMAKEKFNAGFISFYDYDKSKIDFMRAKISYNNMYYDLVMKKAALYMKMSQKIFGKW